ncbi:MAG: enoyl-CoA hydratase/isomerase family protein [Kutzneria sp.]|nr:enoyl-CoA hydratase/isomerase family protein [Kutzneria sp.]MBV9843657.1 enoyl-CoA hydratase/isomerase family protein [Kutzneria sp.]
MTELAEELSLVTRGPVATLTINRPDRHNAFSLRMWSALPAVAGAVEADRGVRVLLIRGAGRGPFSAGADIAEFATVRTGERAAAEYSATVHRAERAIAGLSKPTIALVRGSCVGGGCELALACDLRIADETARFGITPAKLGVIYNQVSTARVVHTVGPAWARYLLLTGELLDADTALRIGLVHQVHPAESAAESAMALAGTLANRAPLSVAGAKQFIRRAVEGASATDGWADRWYTASYRSAEYEEGIAAFLDKRPADFSGLPWPVVTEDGSLADL